MPEFKKGQSVYDTSGYEYLYSDKASDGHYVNKITLIQTTSYSGDDFDEHEERGELIVLKEVFSRPPKAKMNKQIKGLSAKKAELSSVVCDLQREERTIKRSISDHQGKLEKEMSKYPHYKAFLHIAKGGELYRIDKYGNLLNENAATKLSFDIKTGEFDAEVTDKEEYCSVDNGWKVKIFTTLGQARKFFLSNEKFHEFDTNDFSYSKRPEAIEKRYRDLNLYPPEDLNSCLKARKVDRDVKNLQSLEKAFEEAKERLENFKAN